MSWFCRDESQATRIRRQASQLENCDLFRVSLRGMPIAEIVLMMLSKEEASRQHAKRSPEDMR
jgi:hypothetical protein